MKAERFGGQPAAPRENTTAAETGGREGGTAMKAIGLTEFGGPEVLKVVDLPEPQPGPGEVRISVQAVAVNPTDMTFRQEEELFRGDPDQQRVAEARVPADPRGTARIPQPARTRADLRRAAPPDEIVVQRAIAGFAAQICVGP